MQNEPMQSGHVEELVSRSAIGRAVINQRVQKFGT